jgi:hypothetical protein
MQSRFRENYRLFEGGGNWAKSEVFAFGQHDAEFYDQLWSTIMQGKVWKGRLINRKRE